MNKKIFFSAIFILAILLLITLSIVKQSAQINIKPTEKPLIESSATKIPLTEEKPVYGNPGSRDRVSVFFSFEDSKYAKIHEELINFINQNPGKVHFYSQPIAKENWLGDKKTYPLLALYCAEKQEKYWDFLNKAIQLKKIDETQINKIALEINLNQILFAQCLQNKEYQNFIEQEQVNLKISGFDITPNIFVNNKRVNLTEGVKISDILNGVIVK